MSWLRTAVNKAVEVGNRKNITRTVKNYADSVVQQAGQAVAEGAKLFQDRIRVGTYKSVNQTIQRLEEAAVSFRGHERALLITRWLSVLKEIDKALGTSSLKDKDVTSEEHLTSDEAKRREWVLYYDPDIGGQPLNFRDVFLQSQALEGIVLSMIMEPPHDEEVTLLLDMFRLCLNGGKEVHDAIVSSMQDLATVFSSYKDEVLVKQDELIQFAQNAITGLKINAEMLRIDAEASDLRKKLEKMNASQSPQESEHKGGKEAPLTIEALKETLAKIRICSRLEGLLIRKRQLSSGDSPDIHAQKVDKLKVLLESLANSISKAEKRISENRLQKEEALKARVVKTDETGEKEKELSAEIAQLEKQRDELEAELKRVNISLAAAQARFRNATEERDQFGEANNQIIAHLKTKEDDLFKSVVACKKESEVIKTWINFLEDTWLLQCSYTETKDKQTLDELEKHEDYFSDVAFNILSTYKKEVTPLVRRIENYVENLKNLGPGLEKPPNADQGDIQVSNPRKSLEQEYLDYETKIIATFSIVDNMKEHFQVLQSKLEKKEDRRVKELFDDMEKLRQEFEPDYASAFRACGSLVCLSGFRELAAEYLPAISPVCANLTSINFSYANISPDVFRPIIRNCHNVRVFWALDSICDEGLQAVAATCKELRELRIFPFDPSEDSEGPVSGLGLQAISEGCRKLESILYFCQRMTNVAVTAMSENCPQLTVFRLCIMGRHRPDHVTGKPMDDGFGAIVKNCKKLTRLAVSGLLTDQAFRLIGEYGKLIRTLSVAFAGDSDMGLRCILEGCPRLEKLEIRDSPFGDAGLRSGMHRYNDMRFVWMSSCRLSQGSCSDIARALPSVVVEVFGSDDDDVDVDVDEDNADYVEILYMYRSLDGPRKDAPKFVTIL